MKRNIYLCLAAVMLSFSAAAQSFQPTNSMSTNTTEIADFGGGCFWCMEAVFERLPGVISVTSGFAGGTTANPTYEDVCTETTGHAEVTEIAFDSSKISYPQLLDVFWQAHDPTTLNRQGPDTGTSYRSAIFYANDDQKRIAESYIEQLDAAHAWKHKIVTQVAPLKAFYRAEDYHQDYALKNPNNPYIMVCDRPKIATLKADYPDLYVEYKGH